MKTHHYNFIWIFILVVSLIGVFMLVKIAYANPLGLPTYAFTGLRVKEAYSFAKLSPESLDGLPCNCGCMTDAKNHGGRLHTRGLIDCFMNGNVNAGGSWDRHASECGLCYEDALLAKEEYENEKNKEEIKEILMARYAKQIFSNTTVYGGKK